MKISIITVCKNSEAYIEQVIKSVISQSYKEIEYIIIDGNSQDKTKEIVTKYADQVTYFISEPDNSLYEAMNKGIKLATGSFINFINSDDFLYDCNVIQDVVSFINAHPDCDFIYGDTHIRPNPRISSQSSISKPPLPSAIPEEMAHGTGILFLQGAIFSRRELFSKLGVFNEDYKISADYEWFTRVVLDKTLSIYYYPRTIFSFYQGGVSGNITTTLKEMFEIQNQVPAFQSDDLLRLRLLKFQNTIIELKSFLSKVETLSEERRVLIEKMRTPANRFWIKKLWLKFKLIARLLLNFSKQSGNQNK